MVARPADPRAAQVAAAGVIEKRYGEIVMRQTYVTMLSESTDKAPILMWGGVGILIFGCLGLTKTVPEIVLPFHLIAAGLSFFALGALIWRFRLRVGITDEGVYFVPKMFHQPKNFLWSEITDWHWHRYSYTDTDGGTQQEEEIILTLLEGKTLKLHWPYCGPAVVQALERHRSPSPLHEEVKT